MAEARPVPLETLYAEASIPDRELIEALPIGVLRRKLLEAETLLSAVGEPEVRVVGQRELIAALRRATAANEKLKASNAELRAMLYGKGEAE